MAFLVHKDKPKRRIRKIRARSCVPVDISDEKLSEMAKSYAVSEVIRGLILAVSLSIFLHIALKFEKSSMDIIWSVTFGFFAIGVVQMIFDVLRVPTFEELESKSPVVVVSPNQKTD